MLKAHAEQVEAPPVMGRRTFLKKGTAAAVAVGAGGALAGTLAGRTAQAQPSLPAAIRDPKPGEHQIVRMQRELVRALGKPMERRSWAMVVDTRRCIGCDACSVACMAENGLPPGVAYRTVLKMETGTFPQVEGVYKPTNCQQCDNPPCMKVANAISPGAIAKRPDGIVTVDYAKFGRKAFEAAQKVCPYKALSFDEGRYWTDGTPALQAYETRPHVEYGRAWTRMDKALPIGAGRKCHFCLQRIEAGLLPACVSSCVGGAIYFGDAGDGQSMVADLVGRDKPRRINEGMGTRPRVYYIGAAGRATISVPSTESCKACHGQ
ncbi:MAG: 4Fe-4S dicluster domain-containing protein [bacterium]|nr:4Fe-4S dicluster domain-containing protein [bacterium]